ncbi:GNAT family N-acetyltransferase [Aliidiomarina maris]|uniref:RimJ/RimL family protein N-acetyltransferase n=1 Tax=Aliidiomarina maris TaxID=531312 RepID=A0A327WVE5_9GAMM|nr:GNAT family N-acetyltransferase [Aliidiomarina maris]RAJ96956.1 RimJ/RimL family protein N-acetyltransferase [Aliidiomarina maris]RUO24564.1 hypothetical protein CWE07_07790 [Aliidiomarina maris]
MNLSNKKITGKFIELKSVAIEDMPLIHLIYRDEKTTEQARYYYQISIDKLSDIYRKRIDSSKEGCNIDFLIRKNSNREVIGVCTFKEIDFKIKTGEFGIMVHHKFWGSRAVIECFFLCFDFFYENLKLTTIKTAAFTTNRRSRALMQHLDIPLHSIKENVMVLEGEQKDDACYMINIEQWARIKAYLKKLLYS